MESSEANLFVRAWRGSATAWRPAAVFALIGVVAVLASLLPGPGIDDGWTRDLLMTMGSSLALFAPFYLITRSLDSHLAEVATDTRQQVAEVRSEVAATSTALTESVEALRADVDRKLSDVSQQVTERLEAEVAADSAAFDSLRTDAPTRETVLEALERADKLGLTTLTRPPRVNVCESTRLYVSAQFDPGDFANEPLMLRVERTDGAVLDWIDWSEGRTAEDVLVETGLALYKHTGEKFASERLLVGLADLLDAAASNPGRRPAIELCAPQWMVCDWGVVTYNRGLYDVDLPKLRNMTISEHMAEKTWLDHDSWDTARGIALALFPDRNNPWLNPDGDPF